MSYFGSAFQFPIYEALHFISHIPDIINSDFEHHRHARDHHLKIDHEHNIPILKEDQSEQKNHNDMVNLDLKKQVELNALNINEPEKQEFHQSNYSTFVMNIDLIYCYKKFPPPKV